MTISWEETIDDALTFYKYYTETDSDVRLKIRIRQFLFPGLALILLIVNDMILEWELLFSWATLSVVWIVLTPTLVHRKMLKNARVAYQEPENFKNFGAREMTIDSDSFRLKTNVCETLYKWEVVTNVKSIPGYCFIEIAEQDTLIIPEGRLTSEETAALTLALETNVEIKFK